MASTQSSGLCGRLPSERYAAAAETTHARARCPGALSQSAVPVRCHYLRQCAVRMRDGVKAQHSLKLARGWLAAAATRLIMRGRRYLPHYQQMQASLLPQGPAASEMMKVAGQQLQHLHPHQLPRCRLPSPPFRMLSATGCGRARPWRSQAQSRQCGPPAQSWRLRDCLRRQLTVEQRALPLLLLLLLLFHHGHAAISKMVLLQMLLTAAAQPALPAIQARVGTAS